MSSHTAFFLLTPVPFTLLAAVHIRMSLGDALTGLLTSFNACQPIMAEMATYNVEDAYMVDMVVMNRPNACGSAGKTHAPSKPQNVIHMRTQP